MKGNPFQVGRRFCPANIELGMRDHLLLLAGPQVEQVKTVAGSIVDERVAVRSPTVDCAARVEVDQLACLPSGGVHEIDRATGASESRISDFGSVGRDLRSSTVGD